MADNNEAVTLIAPNGMQVSVAKSKQTARLGAGYRLPGKRSALTPAELKGVDDMTAVELKAEIDKRNADREADAKLSKTGDKTALLATLKADDQAQAHNTETGAGEDESGQSGSGE